MRQRRRTARPPRPDGAPSPWPFAGLVLMAGSFFLHAASVTVAPWWAVVLLLVLWALELRLCLRWFTPHPRRLVPVALGGMVLWFAVLVGGAVAFSWG
ncbi:hypothetical protein [Nocardioides sp.]|uniref:hypothetical protein n=1 Tax=Nocardioides sp. TaxID=35761 RepID=UPI00351991F5